MIGMPLRMVDQWREREQKEKETSMPSSSKSIGPDGSEEFVPLLKKARPPMPKAKPTLMIPKCQTAGFSIRFSWCCTYLSLFKSVYFLDDF